MHRTIAVGDPPAVRVAARLTSAPLPRRRESSGRRASRDPAPGSAPSGCGRVRESPTSRAAARIARPPAVTRRAERSREACRPVGRAGYSGARAAHGRTRSHTAARPGSRARDLLAVRRPGERGGGAAPANDDNRGADARRNIRAYGARDPSRSASDHCHKINRNSGDQECIGSLDDVLLILLISYSETLGNGTI